MSSQEQVIATVEENDPDLPKRCKRCPMCGAEILGLGALTLGIANDGSEVCSNRRCGYEWQVFIVEEMEQKIFW